MYNEVNKGDLKMICKYCNKEIPDGSKYCPFCGAYLEEVSETSVNQIKEGSGPVNGPVVSSNSPEAITVENFRSLPTYKPRLHKMLLFLGLALGFFALALLGSLMVRIIGNGAAMVPGIILLIFGLIGGIVFFSIGMSLNRKVFPNVNTKMKGIEILVPLFVAFGLTFAVVALVLQGLVLVIY